MIHVGYEGSDHCKENYTSRLSMQLFPAFCLSIPSYTARITKESI